MTKEKAEAFVIVFGGDTQAVKLPDGEWAVVSTDAWTDSCERSCARTLAEEHDFDVRDPHELP